MKLKNTCGNFFRNLAFDKPENSLSLIRAVRKDENLLRVHYVFKPHSESLTGNFVYTFKQSRIVFNRAFGKIDDMRNAAERRAGFVERDVSVRADAENLNILLHFFEKGVISVALRLPVCRFAVFNVCVRKVYIDMIEKIISHKIDVTLVARYVKPRVLVEIYGFDFSVTRSVLVVVFDHIFIKTYGGGTRCKPEYRVGFVLYDFRHDSECFFAHFIVIFRYNNLHFFVSPIKLHYIYYGRVKSSRITIISFCLLPPKKPRLCSARLFCSFRPAFLF